MLPSTVVRCFLSPCLHTFHKESVQTFHSNSSTTIFLPQAVLYCPPCFPHSDLVAALNSELVSSIKGPKSLPQHGTMVFFSLPLVTLHNAQLSGLFKVQCFSGRHQDRRGFVSAQVLHFWKTGCFHCSLLSLHYYS